MTGKMVGNAALPKWQGFVPECPCGSVRKVAQGRVEGGFEGLAPGLQLLLTASEMKPRQKGPAAQP